MRRTHKTTSSFVMLYMTHLWKGVVNIKAQFSGLWGYIKTGTYQRRFFHLEPAVAPVMDTDIGPLLSAPRSRTGSWPCHKCEHLTDIRKTQRILAHAGATRRCKGGTVFTALTFTHTEFLSHIDTLYYYPPANV